MDVFILSLLMPDQSFCQQKNFLSIFSFHEVFENAYTIELSMVIDELPQMLKINAIKLSIAIYTAAFLRLLVKASVCLQSLQDD